MCGMITIAISKISERNGLMSRHRNRGQGKKKGIRLRDIEQSEGMIGMEYLGMLVDDITQDFLIYTGLLDWLELEESGALDNDQPSLLIYEDNDWYDLKARRRLISRQR